MSKPLTLHLKKIDVSVTFENWATEYGLTNIIEILRLFLKITTSSCY